MSEKDRPSPFHIFMAAYARFVGRAFLVISAASFAWAAIAFIVQDTRSDVVSDSMSSSLLLGFLSLIFGVLLFSVRAAPPRAD